MIAAGIVLMAVMMGGMMFMHMGSHGHSGHGGAHEPPPVAVGDSNASTTTVRPHQMEGVR